MKISINKLAQGAENCITWKEQLSEAITGDARTLIQYGETDWCQLAREFMRAGYAIVDIDFDTIIEGEKEFTPDTAKDRVPENRLTVRRVNGSVYKVEPSSLSENKEGVLLVKKADNTWQVYVPATSATSALESVLAMPRRKVNGNAPTELFDEVAKSNHWWAKLARELADDGFIITSFGIDHSTESNKDDPAYGNAVPAHYMTVVRNDKKGFEINVASRMNASRPVVNAVQGGDRAEAHAGTFAADEAAKMIGFMDPFK